MKITDKSARQVALPKGVCDRIFFDDNIRGFGVRVRGSKRHWIYQYRIGTRQRRITLGAVAAVPLALARKNAGKLEAEVRLGRDPAMAKEAARREAENTFGAIADQFLVARRSALRPATWSEYSRHLEKSAKTLRGTPVAAVTQADIAKLLNRAAGPVSANRLRATLSAMFAWTMQQGTILPTGNPVTNTGKREEQSRVRVLSDAELRTIWAALGNDDYSTIVRLLILTGARADEIGGLRWCELRDDAIELPSDRVKNGKPHVMPLSRPARSIVDAIPRTDRVHVFGRDDTGFQGWSKCKLRLDQKLGDKFVAWRIHDLRRTAASGMQRLGVRIDVIERVLNHVSGSFRGVAGVYARDPMTDDVQNALERWGHHVISIVEGRDATVVPLRA